MSRISLKLSVIVLSMAAGSGHVLAQDWSFNGSGFLTIAVGKVLSGSVDGKNELGLDCPCMISDYGQTSVYDPSWSLKPDSKLGLQGTLMMSEQLSVTGQIVSRGSQDAAVGLEWLYVSYNIDDNNTVQVGRKRIPLFYYSEQQDVSFSYPWLHLPPQTYGWEAVNYNGINWNHMLTLGSWDGNINLFYGNETRKDNEYLKLYSGLDSESDTRWNNITGAEMVMRKNWFEGRLMYLRSENQGRVVSDGEDWSASAVQHILGASAVVDYMNWLIVSELFVSDRTETYGRDLAYSLSAGYRFGDWLPMLTYGKYEQRISSDNPDGYIAETDAEIHDMISFTTRYDLTSSMSLKVQLDKWMDHSGVWFKENYGDATTLSFGLDMVF